LGLSLPEGEAHSNFDHSITSSPEWRRDHRQKRGGEFTFTSLDERTPEDRYRLEPPHNDTPEYGELLRNEIAHTVSGPNEVDEEMRYLLTALTQ
jgi:hypothetical protein